MNLPAKIFPKTCRGLSGEIFKYIVSILYSNVLLKSNNYYGYPANQQTIGWGVKYFRNDYFFPALHFYSNLAIKSLNKNQTGI
ncbi:MAG: hypothetical protein CVU55_05400 [Deltaproteobacteria bacterium HGW-Deltaproteobacteria-13]|nr:MAG: hypothetical protein CVU55_05400 [Deltaproteobacteria bacterium HGW-Deltaproteobacteria-13]